MDKTLKLLIAAAIVLMFFIGLFGFCTDAHAAGVKVTWDANDPTPEGYRVFVRTLQTGYDYSTPAWQGPGTLATITDLEPGVRYALVVRAYQGALESADSNEIQWEPPTENETIVYPGKPKGITIMFLE